MDRLRARCQSKAVMSARLPSRAVRRGASVGSSLTRAPMVTAPEENGWRYECRAASFRSRTTLASATGIWGCASDNSCASVRPAPTTLSSWGTRLITGPEQVKIGVAQASSAADSAAQDRPLASAAFTYFVTAHSGKPLKSVTIKSQSAVTIADSPLTLFRNQRSSKSSGNSHRFFWRTRP